MTIEEKAKAYDEAIAKAQDVFHTSEVIKITDLFPQLIESEDERIRKAIIKSIEEDSSVYEQEVSNEQMIAYLEKQKDTDKAIEAVERIDKYIDEHVANAHDMKDSNPDKKYYRGWDDALAKMSGILQDVYSNEKQKEQKHYWKPTETDVALFNKAVTTNNTLTPAERANLDIIRSKFSCCRAINCSGIMQKEQKPAEIDEYKIIKKHITEDVISSEVNKRLKECGWYVTDEKPVECIEFDNEFENQVSHLLASVLNGEHEYNEGFVKYAVQSLLGYAKNELKPDEWSKREKLFMKALQTTNAQIGQLVEENYKLKEQKLKWSEEDEKMFEDFMHKLEVCDLLTNKEIMWAKLRLKSLRPQPKAELTLLDKNIIEAAVAFVEQNNHFSYWGGIDKHTVIKALRSLKPYWKPSEEQMEALKNSAYGSYQNGDGPRLRELYEQLKKLM